MQNQKSILPLAVITGASKGIGLELAKVFAKNNFDLLIIADGDDIEIAAETLRTFGTHVETLQVDLAVIHEIDKVYEKVKQLGQPINSLILNAGVGISGEFLQTDWETELNSIQLNIVSTVYLTKILLPLIVDQGYGRILFTSSILAHSPGPFVTVYSATKAFIQSFAEAIGYEVKDKGITVTALQPGATETHFFERAEMMNTKAGVAEKDDPAQVAEQGFKALMNGDKYIIAGSFKSKIEGIGAKFLSETSSATFQGEQFRPGSAHKESNKDKQDDKHHDESKT